MSFSLVFPLQTAIREAFKRREAVAKPWYPTRRRVYGWNDYRWFQMAAHYKWYYIFQEVIQFYSLIIIMVIHVDILGVTYVERNYKIMNILSGPKAVSLSKDP